jgi:hypothetical protein
VSWARSALGAGFGPGTLNIFRNILGLPEARWQVKGLQQQALSDRSDLKQSTLSDFLR